MAMYSSVLNVGRRRSRADEKLDIFEARLLRRSRSHLDPVKAIRVKSKIFCQKRYRMSIRGESDDGSDDLEQYTKGDEKEALNDSKDEEDSGENESINVGDNSKSNEPEDSDGEKIHVVESEQAIENENENSKIASAEQIKDIGDTDQERNDDKDINDVTTQTYSDIASIGPGGISVGLDQSAEGKIHNELYKL